MIKRLAGACLIGGAVLLADGVSISAKARLAQVLLHRAWRRTLAGERQVKPWPWADTWPMARLRIPDRDADFIVLSGASGRTLAFGPAHILGTALPGSSGNCALSAHRDTQFEVLRDLREGEVIEVQTGDRRLHRYEVRGARVVEKYETWVLEQGGRGALTLITCYPFDAVVPGGPQRYVVFADLI